MHDDVFEINYIKKLSKRYLLKTLIISVYRLNNYYLLKIMKVKQIKDLMQTIKFIIEFNLILTQKALVIIFIRGTKLDLELLRLENISAAHISILDDASKSNSSVLILEDDFQMISEITNSTVYEILTYLSEKKEWISVNLSISYSDEELATRSFRSLREVNLSNRNLQIFEYSFPVVNTACALYYNKEYLKTIVMHLKSLENAKFIPIDHKINIVLQKITKGNHLIRYASLVPGVFIQRSIRNK